MCVPICHTMGLKMYPQSQSSVSIEDAQILKYFKESAQYCNGSIITLIHSFILFKQGVMSLSLRSSGNSFCDIELLQIFVSNGAKMSLFSFRMISAWRVYLCIMCVPICHTILIFNQVFCSFNHLTPECSHALIKK